MDKKYFSDLDKYYTKSEVSKLCYDVYLNFLSNLKIDKKNITWIEPSAGEGSFIKHLKDKFIAFDIFPQNEQIIKADYLKTDLSRYLRSSPYAITIGNPPFGKRSSLAIEFLNKSLIETKFVGFIVPIQFKKWSVQNKINPNAKLLLDLDLPIDSFLFMGKDFKVRCCFQIWSLEKNNLLDLRVQEKPPISHPDFEMFQYNRTLISEKYFDYSWDFAVPRQGYLDYSKKYFHKEECNKKHQWIFFKAKNKETLNNLLQLDFIKLSQNNTGTPGFGKHDVVKEYISLYK